MNDTMLIKFLRESNAIEGENTLSEKWLGHMKFFLAQKLSKESVCGLHFDLSEGRGIKRGAWRDCNVRVGSYHPPIYEEVPHLMEQYFASLEEYGSWRAHNEFEKIHPFEDLNGRVGRAIWLKKAIDEGYTGAIPFLHKYYYQTLSEFEKKQ